MSICNLLKIERELVRAANLFVQATGMIMSANSDSLVDIMNEFFITGTMLSRSASVDRLEFAIIQSYGISCTRKAVIAFVLSKRCLTSTDHTERPRQCSHLLNI